MLIGIIGFTVYVWLLIRWPVQTLIVSGAVMVVWFVVHWIIGTIELHRRRQ